MTRIATLLIATVFVLGGCASAPQQPAAPDKLQGIKLSEGVADIAKKEGKVDLDKDKRVNCERYTPTGSNRVQYRCTTVAEREQSRLKSQQEMRDMTKPPPSTGAGGIGN